MTKLSISNGKNIKIPNKQTNRSLFALITVSFLKVYVNLLHKYLDVHNITNFVVF